MADVEQLEKVAQENARLKKLSLKAEQDAPLLARMHELSAQYPRCGYRRIRILLAREGFEMGADRAHRPWRSARLQVPKKRRRRRVASSRPRPLPPTAVNHVWAYDFVHDYCANGQELKYLTVVEEFTREALAIEVAGSNRSRHVIEVLSRLVSVRGAPRYLRSDDAPSLSRPPSFAGSVRPASRPPTSRPASLGRTVSTRASMGSSVTSA